MEKGLLVISFGTSYQDTCEKTIEALEKDLAAAFPNRRFYRAWTSGIIRRKLRAARRSHPFAERLHGMRRMIGQVGRELAVVIAADVEADDPLGESSALQALDGGGEKRLDVLAPDTREHRRPRPASFWRFAIPPVLDLAVVAVNDLALGVQPYLVRPLRRVFRRHGKIERNDEQRVRRTTHLVDGGGHVCGDTRLEAGLAPTSLIVHHDRLQLTPSADRKLPVVRYQELGQPWLGL